MTRPVAHVLIRIFAYRFYKTNAGLFLFLFVTVVTYFFFMNVLNETHLVPADRIRYNLIFALSFVSSPYICGAVFVGWAFYTVRSWSFVLKQSRLPEQQFLTYSVTAAPKVQQYVDWCLVQLVLSLPAFVFALFCVVVGLVYQYYLIPVLLVAYVLLVILVSAALYVWYINRLASDVGRWWMTTLTRRWRKPLFSLYLYELLYRQKLTLTVTKLFSWLILAGGIVLFGSLTADVRMGGVMVLLLALAHLVVLYQWQQFENTYLSVLPNLPWPRWRRYGHTLLAYLLLTLPETIWILTQGDLSTAAGLAALNLAMGMLLRSYLYRMPLSMAKFVTAAFYGFMILFLVILFGGMWWAAPVMLAASAILFYQRYYTYK
ncbi:hypothetical protein [Dawidia soli]|uniref:Uncharacterized protein n=1 Tax=Dawidia soli TaxID=2782352 RepID=A0AAP2DF45_9BACT|nr:hypothetical protein [Dawidia soli]MBT1689560.1 hypothetical protein [Dawidia soli]